jgi:NADH:ubiquinone oxidoreductase subunit D
VVATSRRQLSTDGDVLARFQVRVDEARISAAILADLLPTLRATTTATDLPAPVSDPGRDPHHDQSRAAPVSGSRRAGAGRSPTVSRSTPAATSLAGRSSTRRS